MAKIVNSWPQVDGGIRHQVAIATRTHGEVTVLVDERRGQLTTTVVIPPGVCGVTPEQEQRWARAAREAVCA